MRRGVCATDSPATPCRGSPRGRWPRSARFSGATKEGSRVRRSPNPAADRALSQAGNAPLSRQARRVLGSGLCFRHPLRDPWTDLLRTSLGQHAPQNRTDSAVSASERQLVHECLILLTEACTEFAQTDPPAARRSWLQRLLDWFW